MPAGALTVISEEEMRRRPVANRWPKRTEIAPAKLRPQIVTRVPPLVGPRAGEISEIVGVAKNVYLAIGVVGLEPPTAVTVTLEVPEPGGTTALICDREITRTALAAAPPT